MLGIMIFIIFKLCVGFFFSNDVLMNWKLEKIVLKMCDDNC